MRVLHAYSGNLYGGVEAMLVSLARARVSEMESVFALAYEGRLAEELRAAGAEVHVVGAARLSRPWTVLRARRRVSRLARERRMDVLVCHSAWAQAVFGRAARAAGIPLAFWLHDALGEGHAPDPLARRVRPDLALCNSRFTRETLPRLYPGIPAEVVYCPVHPPVLSASPDEARRSVRPELGTGMDEVVFVQVSRMEAWKGHERHLRALGAMAELPGWKCWMVGGAQRPEERDHLARLHALATELGIAERVVFTGERRDVPGLLAAADVFCQPNREPEPFGVALVEALYAGLPVVATASGGAAEVVDAECGIPVPPGDGGALAEALRRLAADAGLRRRLGAAGPARARALCDPERQARRLHEVLGASVRGRSAA
jgi:glycosyltransferase involved in cell wall biosynthesis